MKYFAKEREKQNPWNLHVLKLYCNYTENGGVCVNMWNKHMYILLCPYRHTDLSLIWSQRLLLSIAAPPWSYFLHSICVGNYLVLIKKYIFEDGTKTVFTQHTKQNAEKAETALIK